MLAQVCREVASLDPDTAEICGWGCPIPCRSGFKSNHEHTLCEVGGCPAGSTPNAELKAAAAEGRPLTGALLELAKTPCEPCPRGFACPCPDVPEGQKAQTPCDAYQKQCPPGQAPNKDPELGSDDCKPCPAGKASDSGTTCDDCDPGWHAPAEGLDACRQCVETGAVVLAGKEAEECVLCGTEAAGGPAKYPNPERTACLDCPLGTVGDGRGWCKDCDCGHSASEDQKECLPCAPDEDGVPTWRPQPIFRENVHEPNPLDDKFTVKCIAVKPGYVYPALPCFTLPASMASSPLGPMASWHSPLAMPRTPLFAVRDTIYATRLLWLLWHPPSLPRGVVRSTASRRSFVRS